MNPRKIVFHETAIVLLGVGVCAGLMVGVFALLGYFSMAVVLGALVGTVLAVGNFFFMALTVNLAADKAQSQDAAGGKSLVKRSYLLRLGVLFLLLFACAKSGFFNPLALVLPIVFVRPTLTVAEFFRKKEDHS